jgi:hypothetical protein
VFAVADSEGNRDDKANRQLQQTLMSRTLTNFLESLAAVLAGNAAYFLLMPFLPVAARHVPFHADLGLIVDAFFCVVAWGIVKAVSRPGDLH